MSVALLLGVGGVPVWAVTWADHYRAGEAALRSGAWETAVVELTQAIEARPVSSAHARWYGMKTLAYFPYFRLGVAYANLGEVEAAETAFETELSIGAVRADPAELGNLERLRAEIRARKVDAQSLPEIPDLGSKLEQARALRREGDFASALAEASAAQALDPSDSAARELVETLRQELAARDGAEARAREVDGLVTSARANLDAGRPELAASELRRAIEMEDRPAAAALLARAEAELARRRSDASVDEKLARVEALAGEARYDAALAELEVLLAGGRERSRVNEVRERLLADRGAALRRERSNELLAAGEGALRSLALTEAVLAGNRALSLDPGSGQALDLLARAYELIRRRLLRPRAALLPPSLLLANHELLGGAEELVESSSLPLSIVVFDDGAQLDLRVTVDGAEVLATSLDGVAYGSAFEFRYRAEVPITPGQSTVRLVVEDTDGLLAEAHHRVLFELPWYRRPRVLLSAGGATVFLVLGAVAGRGIRRRSRRRRGWNPFVAGAPIRDPARFVGREETIDHILEVLAHNSVLVSGERRIGKTSLLWQLDHRLRALEDPEFRFVPVYIDLQGLSAGDLFAGIAEQIAQELGNRAAPWDRSEAVHGLAPVVRFLHGTIDRLAAGDPRMVRLVLLVDEVDVLNDLDERSQQKLRSLFMKGFAERLVAVFAGVRLDRGWQRASSPWYNFFEEIRLGPLDLVQTGVLLRRPLAGSVRLGSGVVEEIFDRTGGRPFEVQRLGVRLVRRFNRLGRSILTLDDVRAVAEEESA